MAEECSIPNHERYRGKVRWSHPFLFAITHVFTSFYLLEQSIHKPLLRPLWAIDPSEHLSIFTDTCPPIFKPYSEAIVSNLKQFMDDCGLNATVTCIEGHRMFYSIRLYFQFAYYHKATGMPEDGSLVVSDEFPSNPLWDISEPMQRLLIGRPTLDVGV